MTVSNEKVNMAKCLLDRLNNSEKLSLDEYRLLVESQCDDTMSYAALLADKRRREIYGTDVYVRGLIEIGNYCRNDCYYCGIRKSNKCVQRYLLSDEEIISCCTDGYSLGFRTFVLQGGEGILSAERICTLTDKIKSVYPECAVTLSLGEFSRDEYRRMFDAGADRYLLRHETADKDHYEKMHPDSMSFDNRMRCLSDLKEIGFQVGCGFMVGSPYQTGSTLAKDLKFIEEFSPDMCGIGPFISASGTPFSSFPSGSFKQTIYLISIIRLIKHNILLPATTALGTINPYGRETGIKAGANVVMPNLSPVSVREKYSLYDNKMCTGDESAQSRNTLEMRMENIGYHIVTARGDIKK